MPTGIEAVLFFMASKNTFICDRNDRCWTRFSSLEVPALVSSTAARMNVNVPPLHRILRKKAKGLRADVGRRKPRPVSFLGLYPFFFPLWQCAHTRAHTHTNTICGRSNLSLLFLKGGGCYGGIMMQWEPYKGHWYHYEVRIALQYSPMLRALNPSQVPPCWAA